MTLVTRDDPHASQAFRVMMVDDDREEAERFGHFLDRCRTAFIFEHHDARGDLVLGDLDYDAILLDHHLGHTDGIQVIDRLGSSNRPPVIVVTGDNDPELTERYLTYGVEDFLSKDEVTGPLLERTILFCSRNHTIRRDLEASRTFMAQHARNHAMSEIADGAAHEYNNLTAIIEAEFRRIAAATVLDEGLALRVARVEDALERCKRIGSALVRLAGRRGSRADSAVQAAIDLALRSLQPTIAHISARITVHGDRDLSVAMDGDSLTETIRHLLLNALHAIWHRPDGAVLVRIHREPPNVVVAIADNGCGIDSSDCERVWQPFFSRKAGKGALIAYPDEVHGVGLGLTVVRHLVEGCGGLVSLRSETGQGCTVTLRLPEGVHSTTPVPAISRRVRRIAVIDDNEILRELICEELLNAGCTVLPFADLASATATLEHTPFDAVITDWRLPDGDGGALLANLDARLGDSLPALIISGSPVELPRNLRHIQILGVLQKPFPLGDLHRLLQVDA